MGVTAASVGVAVRTLMIVLSCLMVASLVYVIAIGALASFFDFDARWTIALLTDFSTNFVIIGAWVHYKESSWIKMAVFVVIMFCVGSLATCGYILIQFHKLSSEEFSKDPLYFVLAKHQNRDVAQQTRGPCVVTARVIFSGLVCLVLGVLIYTIVIDLSPSSNKSFGPCLPTYLTDIYIHAIVLSVWVAYKESSWITAFFWILSIFCFTGLAICVYIVRELYYLSPQQPASLIIFDKNSNNDRYLDASDPPLMVHPNA